MDVQVLENPMNISIIIVNYNGAEVVLNCLASLVQTVVMEGTEIIVVDNASTDGSPAAIAEQFPAVRLIPQSKNVGFGAANNVGVAHARGEYVFLLNSDTVLLTDVIPTLVAKFHQYPGVGIVGPRLLNPDHSFQLSTAYAISLWGEFRTLMQVRQYRQLAHRSALAKRYGRDLSVDIVVGAAMMMRRSLYQQVGGFDETFFMYLEESDLCQRVRELGYQILYTPDGELIHIGGYSVAKVSEKMAEEYRRSQRYYYQKHRPRWEQWILHQYLHYKYWCKQRRDRRAN